MKLKLVVASMSVLGVVSCPAFADTTTTTKHTTTHHRMRHHVVATERTVRTVRQEPVMANYKGEAMQTMPEACRISQAELVMDETTQSFGRAMPNPCNPGWFHRVQLSGGINLDLGKWGDRNTGYMGENYKRFSLNDAYINVAANINEWTKAFASISYSDPTTLFDDSDTGEYSAAYANNIQGSGNHVLQLEQAYATMGNLDVSPVYVQVGKQFQDFGRYEIHPITRSMTQVMSETLATSAKVGFIIPMGFHGSVFAFDDPVNKIGRSHVKTDYGVSLGYDQPCDVLGWGVGAAWMHDMIGVNDVAYAVQNFTDDDGYNHRVGAVAVYGDVNSGPFTIGARYTTSLQRFSPLDLPRNGFADTHVVGAPFFPEEVVNSDARGAKPWAAGVQAGYGFEAFGCRNNNVYLGYQTSREAAGLDLPKQRWLLGYGVDVWKNTNFGLEWDHDKAYRASQGGSGRNTDLVSLRAGVQFG